MRIFFVCCLLKFEESIRDIVEFSISNGSGFFTSTVWMFPISIMHLLGVFDEEKNSCWEVCCE